METPATTASSSRRDDMDELILSDAVNTTTAGSEYARMRSDDELALDTQTQSMRIRLRKQKSAENMNSALRGSEVESFSASPYQPLDQSHPNQHNHHHHALMDKVKKRMHLDRARCECVCIYCL